MLLNELLQRRLLLPSELLRRRLLPLLAEPTGRPLLLGGLVHGRRNVVAALVRDPPAERAGIASAARSLSTPAGNGPHDPDG